MKLLKSIKGVTLLEIMLVLAIAAMVIVMSIRYYQSATLSQQVNQTMSQIQSIAAAADNLAVGSNSYTTSATAPDVTSVVGASNMTSVVTGEAIVYTPVDAKSYRVTINLNDAVCLSVKAKLGANKKVTSASCSPANLTYVYDNSVTSS